MVLSLYEKIKMLVGSIRLQDNKVGEMIQIQSSWLQLFAGIGIPLLQYRKVIPYLPPGWITNVSHLLVETGVQIKLSSGWIPTPQRVEDRIIMDLVLKYLPSWTWECINRCRLFLQATTVANLVLLMALIYHKESTTLLGGSVRINCYFRNNEGLRRQRWNCRINSCS